MATTSAERMREMRQRKREAAAKLPDLASDFIRGNFGKFVEYGREDFEVGMPGGIITPPSVAAWVDDELGKLGLELDWRDLKRAEEAVEALANAAQGIAEVINAFKWVEVEAAIARLAQADMSDPEARKAALRQAVELDNIKKRLTRKVRRDFPATVVKGD